MRIINLTFLFCASLALGRPIPESHSTDMALVGGGAGVLTGAVIADVLMKGKGNSEKEAIALIPKPQKPPAPLDSSSTSGGAYKTQLDDPVAHTATGAALRSDLMDRQNELEMAIKQLEHQQAVLKSTRQRNQNDHEMFDRWWAQTNPPPSRSSTQYKEWERRRDEHGLSYQANDARSKQELATISNQLRQERDEMEHVSQQVRQVSE